MTVPSSFPETTENWRIRTIAKKASSNGRLLPRASSPPKGARGNGENGTRAALQIYDRLEYTQSCTIQHRLVEACARNSCPDTLILLEHDPVYTVGRAGQRASQSGHPAPQNLPFPLVEIERGGGMTYHGPGQLVGYPILKLRSFCRGPKSYIRILEEMLCRVLKRWGITGTHIDSLPGIWVGETTPVKIGCIGVHVSRGITMHGFALNVSMDLEPFRTITPCGIPNVRMSSMAMILRTPVDVPAVRSEIAAQFAHCFGVSWIAQEDSLSMIQHDLPLRIEGRTVDDTIRRKIWPPSLAP